MSGHFRAGRIFYGSKIGQPISTKAKTHLDPFPKSFAPPLQMSISKFIEKNLFFGNFTKTAIFGQVLFLLFLLRLGSDRGSDPQNRFFANVVPEDPQN